MTLSGGVGIRRKPPFSRAAYPFASAMLKAAAWKTDFALFWSHTHD
jgi:hypothetical protein